MKKMMLVMAATALVAGTATVLAQSETVTSVNVVGYYSVTIPTNGAALITPVLEPFADAAGTIEDLVGEQLPANTRAYIWDRVVKDYVSATKGARSGWLGDGASRILLRGDAIWLIPPQNGQAHTVTIMGEAPGSYNNAATTTVGNITAADAVGYAYPINLNWTNSPLAKALPTSARLYVWDVGIQDYASYVKLARSGWNTPAEYEIPAGNGFWVQTSIPQEWDEEVPYDL